MYHTILTPREILSSKLKKLVSGFIARITFLPADRMPFKDEQTINTPSLIKKQIYLYCSALKQLEFYVNINVAQIIDNVLMSQIYST